MKAVYFQPMQKHFLFAISSVVESYKKFSTIFRQVYDSFQGVMRYKRPDLGTILRFANELKEINHKLHFKVQQLQKTKPSIPRHQFRTHELPQINSRNPIPLTQLGGGSGSSNEWAIFLQVKI